MKCKIYHQTVFQLCLNWIKICQNEPLPWYLNCKHVFSRSRETKKNIYIFEHLKSWKSLIESLQNVDKWPVFNPFILKNIFRLNISDDGGLRHKWQCLGHAQWHLTEENLCFINGPEILFNFDKNSWFCKSYTSNNDQKFCSLYAPVLYFDILWEGKRGGGASARKTDIVRGVSY